MGFFGSLKNGFWEFINPTKKITMTNNSQVEAARIESDTKIRLAEMEHANKIRLAEMDSERQEAWRTAQLEIIQAQALAQIAIDKARAEGMTEIANQLVTLQDKMLDVATKRIAIIETTTLPIIKDIEQHYDEIGDKISAQRDKYNREKLPQLLALMRQFEANSDERKLFMEQIRHDMEQQNHFIITQTDALSKQQTLTLEKFLELRGQTTEQIQPLLQRIAASYLPQAQASQALPPADTKALPPAD